MLTNVASKMASTMNVINAMKERAQTVQPSVQRPKEPGKPTRLKLRRQSLENVCFVFHSRFILISFSETICFTKNQKKRMIKIEIEELMQTEIKIKNQCKIHIISWINLIVKIQRIKVHEMLIFWINGIIKEIQKMKKEKEEIQEIII